MDKQCRLTTHYTIRMEQGELRKLWIWEPVMSNSLILLLVDPNDVINDTFSLRALQRLIFN